MGARAAASVARLRALVVLDVLSAWRYRLVAVVVVVAAAFGLLVGFVLPADVAPARAAALALSPFVTAEAPAPVVLLPAAHAGPFNARFVPILLMVDVALLGFLFGAVMVLQDVAAGAVAALRVTPARPWEYLASKLLVNLGLVGLNAALLVGLGAPRLLAVPALWSLLLLTATGMCALGLALAPRYRSLSEFFYPLAAVGLVAAAPLYPYTNPAVQFAWTWWIPTWHLGFGVDAAAFAGPSATVRTAHGFTAAFAVISVLAALRVTRRVVFQEHGR
jgi:hypothetical protein